MIRIEDVRLPELSPSASEWDRRLLQALYDQWRDTNLRIWALESTLGLVPRKPATFGYTVATLPTAQRVGQTEYVTDANATLTAGIGTTVVTGGANVVPVFWDGTNWVIG